MKTLCKEILSIHHVNGQEDDQANGTREEECKQEQELDREQEEQEQDLRRQYSKKFLPAEYMTQYYQHIDPEEGFFLENLHNFFMEKKKQEPTSVRVVVELGSGPLVSGLLSAAGWADLLVFSDLLPANLAFLCACLHQPAPALPSLAFVASLEGREGGGAGVLARLLSTPLVTTHCDLLSPTLLPHLTLPIPPTVICLKLCLEFAVSSQQQVWGVLGSIANMLGGLLADVWCPHGVCQDQEEVWSSRELWGSLATGWGRR